MSKLGITPRTANLLTRFIAIAEVSVDPCTPGDAAAALGVHPDSLRKHCKRWLGIGPGAYLRQQRLIRARHALAMAEPGTTTVTAVATAHGFGELSWFAVQYRQTFGERPVDTLRSPPGPARASRGAGRAGDPPQSTGRGCRACSAILGAARAQCRM